MRTDDGREDGTAPSQEQLLASLDEFSPVGQPAEVWPLVRTGHGIGRVIPFRRERLRHR